MPLVRGMHGVDNRTDLSGMFGVARVVMLSFCVLKGGLRIPVGMRSWQVPWRRSPWTDRTYLRVCVVSNPDIISTSLQSW